MTTHGIMFYHPDPDDYWRWTTSGLNELLSGEGLNPAEFLGIMGLASAAVQLFQHATASKVPRVLLNPYIAVMQTLVAFIDRRYSDGSRLHNSLVLAARAERPRS